ncbi:MAG: aminoacyl-tRNA hydrolase [Anaerolineales bacterium]|nr:aminoacyl-tRNA hydrolase [Anaerolineales bacterium]MCB8991737.1 aminoacyl-tRNA hydrolase [Ardenticatenaceae bacterium]
MLVINEQVRILWNELEFRFSTSSGPGGQHANRSATRVTLLFDIAHSPSLPDAARQRLLHKLDSRLTKEGVLQIDVQDSRSQIQNRETAVLRFQTMLANALKVPKKRRKTRPSRATIEKRLAQKKKHSRKKQDRRGEW